MDPVQLELNFDSPITPEEEEAWAQMEAPYVDMTRIRQEAVVATATFITSLERHELSLFTIRKAFEMGYLTARLKGLENARK